MGASFQMSALSFTPDVYYYLVVGLSLGAYVFTTYVDYRQYCVYRDQKKAPKSISGLCTKEEYEKSRLYGFDKARFALLTKFVDLAQSLPALMLGMTAWLWVKSGDLIVRCLGPAHLGEIGQSVVFVALSTLFAAVVGLPSSYYSTFHIEQKHGFNKQTLGLWAKDQAKTVVLSQVFMAPIIAALVWTIHWAGQNFYLAVWLLLAVVQLVMILIFPTFIQPLFNKFDPLPEGELKENIEALAKRLSFPLTKLYVMDGSTRSSHSNAYFFGLFNNKRIVLFDTLLTQMSNDEICAILGHELGHWSCSHLPKRLVVVQVHLFTLFFLFSKVVRQRSMYQAFGFGTRAIPAQPVIIGLSLFQILLTPIEMAVGWAMTCMSRAHEFEADRFGHSLGYGKLLQAALVKLHAKNRAFVQPDWVYSTMHYSHPPLPERLDALAAMDKSKKA